MDDDKITLTNAKPGEKEAAEKITLMDKTPKEANSTDLHNPMDVKLDHK